MGFTQITVLQRMRKRVIMGNQVKTRADAIMRLTVSVEHIDPSKFKFEINWDRKVLHGYKSDVQRVKYWLVELTQ